MEVRAPRVARAEERGEDGGVRDDIVAGQVVRPEEEARGSREVAGPEEAGAHGGDGGPSPAPIERALPGSAPQWPPRTARARARGKGEDGGGQSSGSSSLVGKKKRGRQRKRRGRGR